MPIVSCQCGYQVDVSEMLIGHQVTCNQCNRVHVVPGAVAQPGGYATTGYDQPYAPPQAGGYPAPRQKGPGRWSLITGGVLSIIVCLLWGAVGLVVLLADDVLPMKFEAMTFKQQITYTITVICTVLCGLCLVSASIGFAAKTWAAAFTAGVMLVMASINVYALIDTHDTSKFGAFVFFGVPTFLALGFSAYGVIQARSIQAFRRTLASH